MKKGHRDLVVLLVVVAGLALGARAFLGGRGESPRHDVPDHVQVCTQHLRALHRALVAYTQTKGALPARGGAPLLGALFESGILEDTPADRALLTCPGPGSPPVAMDANWKDAESFGPQHTGYAVRDLVAHPLEKYPTGGEFAFLACDQAAGDNHGGILNVLMADGSVRTFVLAQLLERGLVPPETTRIELGPSSPIELLRVFP